MPSKQDNLDEAFARIASKDHNTEVVHEVLGRFLGRSKESESEYAPGVRETPDARETPGVQETLPGVRETLPRVHSDTGVVSGTPGVLMTPGGAEEPGGLKVPYTVHAGYTKIPNTVLDGLLPNLTPQDQLVYLRLLRLSHGFGRDTCVVWFKTLVKSTTFSRSTVIRSLERLERFGLIARLPGDQRLPNEHRPNTYRVVIPGVVEKPGVGKKPGVGEKPGVPNTPMKKPETKENMQRGRAPLQPTGEALDKYAVRLLALRIREVENQDPNYTIDDLKRDVRKVLIAEGKTFDDHLIDEAVNFPIR